LKQDTKAKAGSAAIDEHVGGTAAGLAAHAQRLASQHRLGRGDGAPALRRLLATQLQAFDAACDALERARQDGGELPAAAGAILDGYPLIDAQLREARGQLLHDDGVLPVLAPAGEVRIYALAGAAVAQAGGHITRADLAAMLAAYQGGMEGEAQLGLAELRLLPAALRLALLDTLRHVAVRSSEACRERVLAADWAGRMLDTARNRSGDLVLLVADMARAVQPLGATFVAELARRLHGRGGALEQALAWIDARLQDEGSGIGQLVERERSALALDGAIAAHCLASLRLLGGVDWRALLEEASPVEALLRTDPDGSYPRMDGPTRDLYRRAIETLARRHGRTETDVAREALALAGVHREPGEGGLDLRRRHVGYYLVGPGRPALERRLRPQRAFGARLRMPGTPLALRIGAVALLSLLFATALAACARTQGAGLLLQALVWLLALPGASQLAVALTDMMASWLAPQEPATPRMDFEGGIPPDALTLVAVSAQLDDSEQVAKLCRDLEQRYLANRDPRLRFCLLADLPDAAEETLPADAAVVAQAVAAIEELNRRHAREHRFAIVDEDGQPATRRVRVEPFLLLQRPRARGRLDAAWGGRAGRRGQLADLHAWLAARTTDEGRPRFATVAGGGAGLAEVRYVIALDAATSLPRDAARRLVEAMAHPLNQPALDAGATRVVEGHAMLRPAIGGALPGRQDCRYQRLWAEGRGSWAAPQALRECASQGMFGWAAIYDVDAWERVMGAQAAGAASPLPGIVEEGCLHARFDAGVRLEQTLPCGYGEHACARQRTVGAAWQSASWLRRPPGSVAKDAIHPMTTQARWRLFDALRDSLAAPALLLLLVLCWTALTEPAFWTAAVLAVFFLPALLGSLAALADRPHDAPWRQHLEAWARGARVPLVRAALATSFLPHAAWSQCEAVLRAVSGRRQAAPARPAPPVVRELVTMWFAPALAVATALLLTFANPYSLFPAAPLLLVWFLSPLLAWWTGLPLRARPPRLSAPRQALLLRVARRSWSFFEDFAGPANNWLPPESVQEQPQMLADGRSTPEGMAVSLLSALGARDFGFVPLGQLAERLDGALSSMALLERWRGHFFAAYDNARLAPIEPAQVSTAGSGWLALSLRILGAGLDELPDAPVAGPQALEGIRATLHVVDELALGRTMRERELVAAAWAALDPQRCRAADTLPGLAECLRHIVAASEALHAGLPRTGLDDQDPLRDWAARLAAQCQALQDDLLALAPWMRAEQEYVLDAGLTRIPTLRELAALEPAPGIHPGLARLVRDGRDHARKLLARLQELARQARAFAAMDFAALFDPATCRLAAGYHVREERLDADSCDQLASEACLASYLAVAQGQLGQRHWWQLGRPLRIAASEQLLLSSDGALSDYLAPQLLLPAWRDTLLDHAGRAAVRAQAQHARRHDMPWGFSESACNAVDASLLYQFRRFGVPGAALRRGAGDDLVAAPYAALLALPLAPGAALANLERMAEIGLTGDYGFVDAVDYTPARLPHGERRHVVRTVAARHQGMGLLALLQVLHDAPMQRRFGADPELRAAQSLLQEPVPARGASRPAPYSGAAGPAMPSQGRVIDRAGAATPEVQLLSNGSYHLMVSSDGSSVSRLDDVALTRWDPDPLGSRGGLAWTLRDAASGEVWLSTPANEAVFAEGRASFRREERGLAIVVDVAVAPEDDVELRRIRIRNTGAAPLGLEVTSHVALAPRGQEVQLQVDAASMALLCYAGPALPTVLHALAVRGKSGAAQYGGALPNPADPAGPLAPLEAATGAAPVLAIRRTLELNPGQETTVDLLLGAAATPAAARALAARHAHAAVVAQALEAAWTHGQAALDRAGLTEVQAQRFNRLAGCLLDPVPALRADLGVIERNVRGRAALSAYGVDGRLPLLVLQPDGDLALAREVLQAHAYWRARGLAADLLVLCESRSVREQIAAMVPKGAARPQLVLLDEVPQEDRILLRAAARVLLLAERGPLAEQLGRAAPAMPSWPAPFVAAAEPPQWSAEAPPAAPGELAHDNGTGGFAQDGREYLVRSGQPLPAPWANPLANGGFGAEIRATGPGASWCGRRTLHLTLDEGEAFYLRDDDSGAAWSPTPWPMLSGEPYVTRHGFGYTLFEHVAHGIASTLRCFVAVDAPLKYSVLTLRNASSAPRRLSVTGYVQWWLDEADAPPGLQVVSGVDLASGALTARNAFGAGFADKVAFFHVEAPQVAHTADRREFVGRHRSLARPAALERNSLSGSHGAALDPCAALQVRVELQPGEERELVFLLGVAGPDALAASQAVQQHGGGKAAARALRTLHAYWDGLLGSVRVATPEPAFDLFANGWLPYGALACTRGEPPALQLQGALAALHGSPATVRETLLRAARADIGAAGAPVEDFLWLPWTLQRYLAASGDYGILREAAGGDPSSGTRLAHDDLYQYCVHGLRGCLRFGPHGLPLRDARMHEEETELPARPEDAGLAFLLAAVLQGFADVADRRADFGFATTCRGAALALKAQAEEYGWNGKTYGEGEAAAQAWAALAEADPGRVAAALATVDALDAAADARAAAWLALAFAGQGAATRAWQLAMQAARPDARVRSPGTPYFMMDGAASGWTCMLLADALLGIERSADRVALAPLLPAAWDGLRIYYRPGRADYDIAVRHASQGEALLLDGQPRADNIIEPLDDGREHKVELYVERRAGDVLPGPQDNQPGKTT
jgi:cellobiose phosphorylase